VQDRDAVARRRLAAAIEQRVLEPVGDVSDGSARDGWRRRTSAAACGVTVTIAAEAAEHAPLERTQQPPATIEERVCRPTGRAARPPRRGISEA
jgi:hypothetical protein